MFVNSDFSDLLRHFNAGGVRYLVVGGYAVVQYAEPRYTTVVSGGKGVKTPAQTIQRQKQVTLQCPDESPEQVVLAYIRCPFCVR
jgi:hypothetical protein